LSTHFEKGTYHYRHYSILNEHNRNGTVTIPLVLPKSIYFYETVLLYTLLMSHHAYPAIRSGGGGGVYWRLLLLVVAVVTGPTAVEVVQAQSIVVNKACVPTGGTFAVIFQNINPPQFNDWIGIIPASDNTAAFENIGNWVWTCGSKSCGDAAASGRIRFHANAAILPSGVWVAVLSRSPVAPFSAYAVSAPFTISATCGGTSSATLAPTVAPPVPVSGGGDGTTTNALALGHLAAARSEMESLIFKDFRLAPQFLRMAFHDCIGGCDGTFSNVCCSTSQFAS
jgi:hypothetical protein